MMTKGHKIVSPSAFKAITQLLFYLLVPFVSTAIIAKNKKNWSIREKLKSASSYNDQIGLNHYHA